MPAKYTYTIAITDAGLLAATVIDGGGINSAIAAAENEAQADFGPCEIIDGLTLTDDPQDGDAIVYAGHVNGFLMDQNGTSWDYAVRRQ